MPVDAFEAQYGHEVAERAAILEFLANLPRMEAERKAVEEWRKLQQPQMGIPLTF